MSGSLVTSNTDTQPCVGAPARPDELLRSVEVLHPQREEAQGTVQIPDSKGYHAAKKPSNAEALSL